MFHSYYRTNYLPSTRELGVTQDKIEWVADVLEKYLTCKYSKLPDKVYTELITVKSTFGGSLRKCLKSKNI